MSATLLPYLPFSELQEKQLIEPILVGSFFMFTLFGTGLLQFYHIYRMLGRSVQDETWNYLVLFAFLVVDFSDTVAKAIFASDTVKNDLIGGLEAAGHVPRTIFTFAFTSGLIAAMTHLFYAARVYRVTLSWERRNWVRAGLTLALVVTLVQFTAACAAGWVSLQPSAEWHKHTWVGVVWLGGSIMVDLFLCFMMVYYLGSQKSDYDNTNDMVQKSIALTLETGLFPTCIQVTELCLFLVYSDKPYSIAINYLLPKSYLNCVLVLFVSVLAGRDSTQNVAITGGWRNKNKTKSRYVGGASTTNAFVNNPIMVQNEMTTVIDGAVAVELRPRNYGGEKPYQETDKYPI